MAALGVLTTIDGNAAKTIFLAYMLTFLMVMIVMMTMTKK